MTDHKTRFVIVSGFSGVGKGYVLERLMDRHDCYGISVSATTRAPRENEKEGVDYFYITEDEFVKIADADGMVEHAGYSGNRYGTLKSFTGDILNSGRDCILEIEVQGAMIVKEKHPDSVMIYILPPDARTWVNRLEGRGTEKPETIARRKKQAVVESARVAEYEYVLMNGAGEEGAILCAEQLHEIVTGVHNGTPAEQFYTTNNKDFIERIHKEVVEIVEGEK